MFQHLLAHYLLTYSGIHNDNSAIIQTHLPGGLHKHTHADKHTQKTYIQPGIHPKE